MGLKNANAPLSRDAEMAKCQILTAAERLFETYGAAKTTMDDIGRAVGVSRQTVYRYFRDRDSLMAKIIERRSRKIFADAENEIKKFTTFAEKFIEGLIFLVDSGRRDPIIRVLVSPESMQMAQPLVDSSGLAKRLTAEMWTPLIEEAIESGQVRRDLEIDKVCEWIALLEFILVGRLDFSSRDDPSHRELLETFVIPALVV